MTMNLYAGWIAFFVGCVAGAIPGLFFHDADWLGGYASWPRRMIRLGHISFFGLGGLNVAFALTAPAFDIGTGLAISAYLFVVGLATMPLVCYLSAYRTFFRNLFFIPALSMTVGVANFLIRMVLA